MIKKCNVCGNTFNHFIPYKTGTSGVSEYLKKLRMIGSDLNNFGCIYCGAHDRERHLFLYFDSLNLWEAFKDFSILHLAPESKIRERFKQLPVREYVMGDLYPGDSEIETIDATDIKYPDNKFDILICNHVLEHIPDYRKALNEFFRVLKPGGMAILQTPFSKLLKNNFEDENINTDELRLYFYGQEDHVRTFGEFQFLKSIEDAGFKLEVKAHTNYISEEETYMFGVNPKEDLILVVKN